MEDRSEDLPKAPRRTAARPFIAPRPKTGEAAALPLELNRHRPAHLFTPPGSRPATPAAAKPATPAPIPTTPSPQVEEESNVDFEGDATPAPLPVSDRALEDSLVVELYEQEEIELNAGTATNVPDEHSIEVIAYDQANSLLKASANEGENPEVDGMYLEATEFTFEGPVPGALPDTDDFWATEPIPRKEPVKKPVEADETEATMDAATASEHDAAINAAASILEEESLEWADDPSTTIAHAQAAVEPEPEHRPVRPEFAPPWMDRRTPMSSPALESVKESEPWEITPAHGEAEIVEDVEAPSPMNGIADALERIAARVRSGELDVPAGGQSSDEAAVSAVLTALLRLRH